MKYFQVTCNLSICFTLRKSPSCPLPPISELKCVCNWSRHQDRSVSRLSVLTLVVHGTCMFGCVIALLTSFQMSPSSSMGKLSQDLHYWEEALIIYTMAGMATSWCTVSKQQMLFCCSPAQFISVICVLQMLLWSFFFALYPETINLSDRRDVFILHLLLYLQDW